MHVSQAPRCRVAPNYRDTYGDLAGDFAGAYGLTPDEWQRIVLDDWLAVRGGRWVNLSCGLSVPRQNGKNALIEIRELFGMVARGERILHTAHEVKTARAAFKRLQFFFGTSANDPGAKFPELNGLVDEIRNVNGQESITLKNGGAVQVIARSKNSGRGFTVDTLVMDEAQEMSDDDLEALMPTTSAAPLGSPQWIMTGTPPGPRANGEVFTRTRSDALSGKSKRSAWHEWSPEPGADLDSREVWRATNPALITGRLSLDVVEGERAKFSDEGFARERCGAWATTAGNAVIDPDSWAHAADELSTATDRLALAVDVTPDRSSAAVALAGIRADGLWHVELDEHRKGTGWLAGWIVDRLERNDIRAVVIDAVSPAVSLIDELAKRRVTVTTTGAREMSTACANIYDAVMDNRVRHIDQPQLTYALSVARKRPIGDGWGWNRRGADDDISPIVAATLALYGAQHSTVKKPMKKKRSSGRRAVVV